MAALVLLVLLVGMAPSYKVTVVPWCNESFRILVKPNPLTTTTDPSIQRKSDPTAPFAALTTRATPPLNSGKCEPGDPIVLSRFFTTAVNGNLGVTLNPETDSIDVFRVDAPLPNLFTASFADFTPSANTHGYYTTSVSTTPGNRTERIFGLGQGNWTTPGNACASGAEKEVPFERGGQTARLIQRKFGITIPWVYSTAGYGFLWNMPCDGSVTIGAKGVGGMEWVAAATLEVDLWVTGLPSDAAAGAGTADRIYSNYADATGHAPHLPPDAMGFWQSRNYYQSSEIALDVASRYKELGVPVGVLVIDRKNIDYDGDFAPNPTCYPSLLNLSTGIRQRINATTIFSIWPQAVKESKEYATLEHAGCLINPTLGGRAIDPTTPACRSLIWNQFLKPRYYDQGVQNFWLDESDGEGTGGAGDGDHGYDTSYGPAEAYSNLWVNAWIATFTDPVAALAVGPYQPPPMVLTRGIWAGGQRHGAVLWSSDTESTFEELTAQIPLGVHASLSGIPWWTSDVGGYGCGQAHTEESAYMQELIVRWYQFGLFCPVFRTHGMRETTQKDPNLGPTCRPRFRAGFHGYGPNEIWSYGNKTQVLLTSLVVARETRLKSYIAELDANVTAHGMPTMRPLWYDFPEDEGSYDINNQYMLGPKYLVAPVTKQGLTSKQVYFPECAGCKWKDFFTGKIYDYHGRVEVKTPLERFPVYERVYE